MTEKRQLTTLAQTSVIQFCANNGLKLNSPELSSEFTRSVDPILYATVVKEQGESINHTIFADDCSQKAIYDFARRRRPKPQKIFDAGCIIWQLDPGTSSTTPYSEAYIQRIRSSAISYIARLGVCIASQSQQVPMTSLVFSVEMEELHSIEVSESDIEVIPSFETEQLVFQSNVLELVVEAVLPTGLAHPLGRVLVNVRTSAVGVVLHQNPNVFSDGEVRQGRHRIDLVKVKDTALLTVVLKKVSRILGKKPSSVSVLPLGKDLFEFQKFFYLQPKELEYQTRLREAVAVTPVGRSLKQLGFSNVQIHVQEKSADGFPRVIFIVANRLPLANVDSLAA
jgi:hypothetical protein